MLFHYTVYPAIYSKEFISVFPDHFFWVIYSRFDLSIVCFCIPLSQMQKRQLEPNFILSYFAELYWPKGMVIQKSFSQILQKKKKKKKREKLFVRLMRQIKQCNYCVFHNSAEFIFKRQRPNCVLASINQTSDANHTWRNQLTPD